MGFGHRRNSAFGMGNLNDYLNMAKQDRFRLKHVWIEEGKGDSNPTNVKTYLLGLLLAILTGSVFGLVSLLLIVTTEELSIVLYLLVSILVSMSPRLLLRKSHCIYTTAICMLPPIISFCILLATIKFEDPTEMVVIGILSIIMSIIGGWIKMERKGGDAVVVQKD